MAARKSIPDMNDERNYFRDNDWLYHFTNLASARKIICEKRLKFSLLRRTNDSCENAKCIYNQYSPQQEKDILEDIEREIYHYQQISLSENKPVFGRKGFDLQQMWGIYADSGYGVCLIFDKNELLNYLTLSHIHAQVSYVADFTPDVFTEVNRSEDVEKYIKENAKALFFTKRKEWEHEQEYRIINRFDETDGTHYLDIKDSLKYIVLYNSKTTKGDESILDSCEYLCLQKLRPVYTKVLVYSSFLGVPSLICYEDDPNGYTLWNSSGEYEPQTDIDV